jgi:hypothetical protein
MKAGQLQLQGTFWLGRRSGERAHDVELGLRLAGALRFYWLDRNLIGEGRRWLDELLEAGTDVSPTIRAKALAAAARLAQIGGDHERARELNERSLALYRGVGDPGGVAWALTGWAIWRSCGETPSRLGASLTRRSPVTVRPGTRWASSEPSTFSVSKPG